jgi:hypothetical protein
MLAARPAAQPASVNSSSASKAAKSSKRQEVDSDIEGPPPKRQRTTVTTQDMHSGRGRKGKQRVEEKESDLEDDNADDEVLEDEEDGIGEEPEDCDDD